MSTIESKAGRGATDERRYVIAYGDALDQRVERAPDSYGGNLLTRAEAAQRISDYANFSIYELRKTRDRANRILREERRKAARASREAAR
ncbi:conserved hypothetical protein [Ancylobacter novellus DSM 506]|uniref:Uncharacterized protein n=1 Tax=Ancylobacter novellus (strain ATCC 8093 / DSM 506 / JCM 20403 / CCM 1077 / IAM 12100 / NBRC 12443 / NCIMB 10456) TaxID=639283 RepID=D7A3Y6_ANCN5|nr:hypothetical protein [Ancylobacter novellus]ADH91763.1 conserved hypothetical protein [Ancylobacter novellus DSM 506]